MAEKLVYKAPPVNTDISVRRVYLLPESLVKRIHEFGYLNECQSEVAAVRKLLEDGLRLNEGSY